MAWPGAAWQDTKPCMRVLSFSIRLIVSWRYKRNIKLLSLFYIAGPSEIGLKAFRMSSVSLFVSSQSEDI